MSRLVDVRLHLIRVVLLALVLPACAVGPAPDRALGPPPALPDSPVPPGGRFSVERDVFAFPNLVRAENPGRNGAFANHCLTMTRAASQFFRFARFAPDAPAVPVSEHEDLVRRVLGVEPRQAPWPGGRRIVIPGYPDLRAYSRAHEATIKAALGSNVLSMIHWRTWRVAFALPPAHQERLVRELRAELDGRRPALVMITNYPDPDLLNHAVLVYDYRVRTQTVEFLAYDPNDPDNPMSLDFDPATGAFWVGPLPYASPGPVRAFRLFGSPLL